MKKYVRLYEESVTEVFVTWYPGFDDIYDYLHPDLAKLYLPAPDEVTYGWIYHADTNTFTAPPPYVPDPEPEPEEPGEGEDPVAAEPAGKA